MNNQETKHTWRLDLTDKQFNCIMRGMEFYGRLLAGQLDVLREATPQHLDYFDIEPLRARMFPELDNGQHYKWNGGSPSEWHDREMAQAYQIYREMRHQDVSARYIENTYSSPTPATPKAEQLKVTRI